MRICGGCWTLLFKIFVFWTFFPSDSEAPFHVQRHYINILSLDLRKFWLNLRLWSFVGICYRKFHLDGHINWFPGNFVLFSPNHSTTIWFWCEMNTHFPRGFLSFHATSLGKRKKLSPRERRKGKSWNINLATDHLFRMFSLYLHESQQ